jgi:hypothetical protein
VDKTITNTTAYCDAELITAAKSFVINAFGKYVSK